MSSADRISARFAVERPLLTAPGYSARRNCVELRAVKVRAVACSPGTWVSDLRMTHHELESPRRPASSTGLEGTEPASDNL